MRNLSIFTLALFAFGLFMVPSTFAGEHKAGEQGQKYSTEKQQQQKYSTQGQKQKSQQQKYAGKFQQQKGSLITVDHLIGAEIQNQNNKTLGEIDQVLLDIKTGQAGYVTVSGGGLLGVGVEKYIVPFNALQTQMPAGEFAEAGERELREMVFTLKTQKDQLKEFEGDIETALTGDEMTEINEYYGVSPYWEEGSFDDEGLDEEINEGLGEEGLMEEENTREKKY